jgi:hypothetical protein
MALLLVAGLLAPAVLLSPSEAAPLSVVARQGGTTPVSVVVDDFVYRSDDCYSVAGTISVTGDVPYSSWEADIEVTGPQGEYADSDWISSTLTEEQFDALFACFYLGEFGKHTARADVTFYDSEYNVVNTAIAMDSFFVKAGSRLKMTKVVRLPRVREVHGTIRATGGITPTLNHRFDLQRFRNGLWRTVASVYDGKGGDVVIRYGGRSAGKFRLRWKGVAAVVEGDVSATFRLG